MCSYLKLQPRGVPSEEREKEKKRCMREPRLKKIRDRAPPRGSAQSERTQRTAATPRYFSIYILYMRCTRIRRASVRVYYIEIAYNNVI